jgi:hypothetical protein
MITDDSNQDITISNIDLGFSAHKAQILYQRIDESLINVIRKENRHFTQENMKEFNRILKDELWGDVFTSNEVDTSFHAFSAIFGIILTVFPLIRAVVKNKPKNTWITKVL